LFVQAHVDFFSIACVYKTVYFLDQLFRTVSSAWLNSLGYNLVSWFIFPRRKQKSNKMNFEKCAYIDDFVKFGHIYKVNASNINCTKKVFQIWPLMTFVSNFMLKLAAFFSFIYTWFKIHSLGTKFYSKEQINAYRKCTAYSVPKLNRNL